ncbi:MAG: hypothetical protein M1832_000527 [Thelocarpon impressellum]|nr:MAG: hypothetical protein M1832_000527 [Thelocarpon impressellum]
MASSRIRRVPFDSLDPSRALPGSFPDLAPLASASLAGLPDTMEPPPPPTLDLRSLDYVSPVDDNLMCSVCHCAFIKPVMTARCEHIFCADCFETASRQQEDVCPFCRTKTEGDVRPAPRALANMADDLRVKCPNSDGGCDTITTRGCVQAHVDKYCGYAEVDCPEEQCASRMQRREATEGCPHKLVACEDCREMVVQRDLQEHRENECQNRWLECSNCDREILHFHADVHAEDCPELVVRCPGEPIGCNFTSRRRELHEHTVTCTFHALEPFIRGQSERIQALEVENKIMRRKWDNLSVGELPDQMAEASRLPLFEAAAPAVESDNTAFDSAIHHLMSSYESLRSDVERLSSSMSELDARHSVVQMNESLRIKEDFSHLNAVIGSMRVQLHWLTSTRLGQPRTNALNGNGQGVAGPSRATATGAEPPRRISDTPRQDTKL